MDVAGRRPIREGTKRGLDGRGDAPRAEARWLMFLFAFVVWMSYVAWWFFLWSLAIIACGVVVALVLAAYLVAIVYGALVPETSVHEACSVVTVGVGLALARIDRLAALPHEKGDAAAASGALSRGRPRADNTRINEAP
jgi:hypothetical protein